MFDTARFQIIGGVGKVKTFDEATRASIGTNAAYKDEGEWVDRTVWNKVTIFDRGIRGFV